MAHSIISFKDHDVTVKDVIILELLEGLCKYIDRTEYSLKLKDTLNDYFEDWEQQPSGCRLIEVQEHLKTSKEVEAFKSLLVDYLNSKEHYDEFINTCNRLINIL